MERAKAEVQSKMDQGEDSKEAKEERAKAEVRSKMVWAKDRNKEAEELKALEEHRLKVRRVLVQT